MNDWIPYEENEILKWKILIIYFKRQSEIEEQSKKCFKEICKQLKHRRKVDTESFFHSLIDENEDTSIYNDKSLDEKLNENKKIARQKQEKVINLYENNFKLLI